MSEWCQTVPALEDVRRALAGPLPGVDGQKKMSPSPAPAGVSRWTIPGRCRQAGVLLLLYPHADNGHTPELHLILIRRPKYPGAHSGQISFPGGRRENSEALRATALRETWEEVGVSPENVEIVGQLSTLYTPPSNYCIYPFVAFCQTRPPFKADPREVAELIEVPLKLLFNPDIWRKETWHFEKYGARQVPYFDIYGHKVWGATAMILSEFLTLFTHL
jgi:8-oxo-dGTP pyrophosphatase MutT (NUDIX family)